MKKSTRFVFGLLSSILFAVGLVRASDAFSPLNRQLGSREPELGTLSASPDSINECAMVDEER